MIHGVIIVRKEKGMTSFGVVARMRRIFGQKKIGHTGTLDPDAEGVLPVCMGRATRLVDTFSSGTKTYEAGILLGQETDTQDISGKVLRESVFDGTESDFREMLMSFTGRQMQLPPMYSALKVNGQKLVDLARRGIEVERQPREVEFSEISLLRFEPPHAVFRVTCSHGTYIRTLCHDLGQKLGCGACMESLIRTRVEEFGLEEALTLDELTLLKEKEDREGKTCYSFVRPVDSFYAALPSVTVKDDVLKSVLSGHPVKTGDLDGAASLPEDGAELRAYTGDGTFIGIYRKEKNKIRLVKYYYEDY